ncbi:MAG: RHS repeat protein, partial [Clostridia bacterium]|nr:RHS repeat protein [Clostridia bacterium]
MKKGKTFLAFLLALTLLLPQLMTAAIDEEPQTETHPSKREYNTNLTPYTGPLVVENGPMRARAIEGQQTVSGDSYNAPITGGRATGKPPEESEEELQTFAAERAVSTSDASTYQMLQEPSFRNNIKEPHMSGRSATAEVSPYSGDLQLNYTDISLPGKNGLDLNLTRFYQSNQSHVVSESGKSDNGHIRQEPTTYFNERYALGLGWSFGFPSVEVKKARNWDGILYDKNTKTYNGELYYHDGTGSAYRVNSKDNPNETLDEYGNYFQIYNTNLDNYYTDNVKFRDTDHSYERNGMKSQFSFCDAEGTMQYFGKQGQLLAIVDRFGNEIKFDYTDMPGENLTHFDSYQKFSLSGMTNNESYIYFQNSSSSARTGYFATNYVSTDSEVDTYTMGFAYYAGETLTDFSGTMEVYVDVRGSQSTPLSSELIKTITPTTQRATVSEKIEYTLNRSAYSEPPRSLRLRVEIKGAKGRLEVDDVRVQPHKPLLSKITDTLGRTLEFTYNGDLYQRYEEEVYHTMEVAVKDPDGTQFRNFVYYRARYSYDSTYDNGDGDKIEAQGWYYTLFVCDVGQYYQNIDYQYMSGTASSWYPNEAIGKSYTFAGRPYVSHITHRNSQTYINYEEKGIKKTIGSAIDTPRSSGGFETMFRVAEVYDNNLDADETAPNPKMNRTTYDYSTGFYRDETGCNYSGNYGTVYGLDPEFGSYQVKVTNPSGSVDTYAYTKHTFEMGKKRKRQIKLNLPDKQTSAESAKSGADNIVTEMLYESDYKINSPTQTTVTETIGGVARKYITRTEYDENSCLPVKTSLPLTEAEAATAGIPTEKAMTTTYQNIGSRTFLPKTKKYYQSSSVSCTENVVYDTQGRVTETVDAAGNSSYLEYDATYPWLPSRVYYKDPENRGQQERISEILYDNTGGHGIGPTKVKTKYQDGKYAEQQMTYELRYGNVATQTDANGAVTMYTYDTYGRPQSVRYPNYQKDGSISYLTDQYNYWLRNKYEGINYASMTIYTKERPIDSYWNTTTVSTQEAYYDDYGYMVYCKDNIGEYRYFYDTANRPIAAQDPRDYGTAQKTQQVTYDGWGRTLTATDRMGNVQKAAYKSLRTDYSFVPVGTAAAENHYSELADMYGNVIETRSYPNGMSESNFVSQKYTYDLVGNVTKATDANGNVTTYAYDKL